MSKEDLKPCPFCGGEAKLDDVFVRVGYDEYERHESDYVCVCTKCGSSGSTFRKKWFSMFTEYTVQQFREDTALRAREEDRYDEYLDELKQSAIESWNRRA